MQSLLKTPDHFSVDSDFNKEYIIPVILGDNELYDCEGVQQLHQQPPSCSGYVRSRQVH